MAAWLALGSLIACADVHKELLEPADQARETARADGGDGEPKPAADAGPAGGSGGASGAGGTAGVDPMAGMGGAAGMPGALDAGVDAGPAQAAECFPNPDRLDEVCPLVCPETCNGEDDDCDLRIDEGEADLACSVDHTSTLCSRGECIVVECLDGYRDCDGDAANGCEVAEDDPNHCGLCGRACALDNASAICVDGACQVAMCAPDWGDCDADLASCETETTSLDHCGACNAPCGGLDNADPACVDGVCEPARCLGNFGNCDQDPANGCELALDALDNCGGCGVPCDLGGGAVDCATGVCVAVGCDPGYADCDQSAATACDSLSTPERCGSCGTPCTVAALDHVDATSCDAMVCNVTCESGFGDCDAEAGCETALRSRAHCGACDTPCALDHAVVSCASGSCQFVRCEDGFGDCNQDTSDGCEQPLDTLSDCDGCGIRCDLVSCNGGTCSSEVCTAPMADCDLANNDCEVNLSNTLAHCGGCNNACAFTVPPADRHASLECVASACRAVCDAGFGDCDGDHENGCETPLTTLTDCGQCGTGCSAVNATATCASGQCRVEDCDPDWKDCDQDGRSCEREIDTVSDCGDCGASCTLDNAFARCGGTVDARACRIDQCIDVAFKSCDTDDLTGCEVDTRIDASHCGACNNDCLAQPHVTAASCVASACQPTGCQSGWANCGPGAGCETALGTIQHCGGCGDDCSLLDNTQATSCNQGSSSCQITTCDAGFASCDGTVATGCETDILSLADCGGCASLGQNEPCQNLPHVAQSSCGAGACKIDSCDANWDDCDLDVQNGCERDLLLDGPCYPDTNCTRQSHGDALYFFCTNDNDWAGARALCLTLTRGDLVTVESSAENAFLAANFTGDAWIGARDAAAEGLWRWERTGVPFWQGLAAGASVLGNYASWDGPQPDAFMDAEDCGELWSGGAWNDQACSAPRDFICEVIPDRCPADGGKLDPGQCGCGSPDTDSDMDGFAVCNDACDGDAQKLAPGACGCGNPDLDDDSDGFFNCEETCTSDPAKQDPGDCGCGNPDTDTDSDGTADCIDGCPLDAAFTGACAYKQLSIGASFVDSALSDFPVLVRIAGDSGLMTARDDGLDVFFSTDGGPSDLDFEIEHFDRSAGDLLAWVRIPSVAASADTVFYLRYGDGSSSDRSNAAGVWTSGYRAVYHMDYGGGAGTQLDATSYGHDLSADESARRPVNYAAAPIGDGLTFDGTDDRLLMIAGDTTGSDLDITSKLTLSGWFYAIGPNPADHAWYIVTKRGPTPGTDTHFAALLNKNFRALDYYHGDSPNPGAAGVSGEDGADFSLDAWVHFSITVDQPGDEARWYTDGQWRATERDSTGAVNWLTKVNNFPLGVGGGLAGGDIAFRGHLDEIRVSATVRSAAWIRAEYENQRPGSSFLAISEP